MKSQVKQILVTAILIIFGVMLILMGLGNMADIRNYKQIDAVVTSAEEIESVDKDGLNKIEFVVTVKYTVDGTEYLEPLQYAEKGYFVEGQEVSVLYDPDEPENVTGATKGGALVRLAMGILLLIGGIGGLLARFISVSTGLKTG